MSETYEIRSDGVTLCHASSLRSLGYSLETLKDMERSGLLLYRNGKRLRVKNVAFKEATE